MRPSLLLITYTPSIPHAHAAHMFNTVIRDCPKISFIYIRIDFYRLCGCRAKQAKCCYTTNWSFFISSKLRKFLDIFLVRATGVILGRGILYTIRGHYRLMLARFYPSNFFASGEHSHARPGSIYRRSYHAASHSKRAISAAGPST